MTMNTTTFDAFRRFYVRRGYGRYDEALEAFLSRHRRSFPDGDERAVLAYKRNAIERLNRYFHDRDISEGIGR
jgi:hypothetical protein